MIELVNAPRVSGNGRLKVASVTRVLPVPGNPSLGIFVAKRLEAMNALMDVQSVQPVPYLPAVRPLPSWIDNSVPGPIRVPMLYIPKFFKNLDAWFLHRAIRRTIGSLHEAVGLDVLDAHFGYPDGAAVVRLGRELDIPAVVTLRGVEAEQLVMHGIGRQLRAALRAANGVICVSHFLEKLALDAGVRPEKIRVIHNAVDRLRFHPVCKAVARREVGLDNNRPIVVSVGHLVERKGHHILIQAMKSVLLHAPDAQLVIIGAAADPAYARRLERMIRDCEMVGAVKLLGNLDPMAVSPYLQAADVFALMTSREGCCNAILEALACGAPVVTTDTGDNAHFVRNDINGRIVPRKVENCAQALIDLLDQRPFRSSDVSESLKIGGWDQVASQISHFLRDVVCGVKS